MKRKIFYLSLVFYLVILVSNLSCEMDSSSENATQNGQFFSDKFQIFDSEIQNSNMSVFNHSESVEIVKDNLELSDDYSDEDENNTNVNLNISNSDIEENLNIMNENVQLFQEENNLNLTENEFIQIGENTVKILEHDDYEDDYNIISDNVTKNNLDLLLVNANETNSRDHSSNYVRISRQKLYEEPIEYLDNVDSFFAMRLNTNGVRLILRHKHGSNIIENPSYNNEQITKKPEPGQRSLVIIFDGTGSMKDDLQQLTDGAEAIISEITKRENNPIYNYIFVPFRDPYIGPKLITQDLNRLLTELRSLQLFGGGDCPESPIGAINHALESALPNSLIFVFTDAIANDYKLDQTSIDLVQKHQATLTFLLTGFCSSKDSEGYFVFEKLAALSNGQVFNLQKMDIREVLESIRTSLDKDLVPLDYVYSKTAGSHSIDIPVDANFKELTVSVAGQKPNITLIDPNKIEQKDVNELVNLDNIKIVNVQDPIPGKWNVHTDAGSEHSVKLTALSDFKCNFGFSLNNPKSLSETKLNPIKGIPNVLSIVPSNDSLINVLTSVELVPIDFDPSENIPNIMLPLSNVKSNDGNSSLYVTKPFPPPMKMFKIFVNGFDVKGNPLKYLISTAIKAIDPDKPKISIPVNYIEFTEGENGTMECQIDTLFPATVSWKRRNEILESKASDQLNTIEYVIDKVKLEDSGSYSCLIENDYGADEQIVNVIVKENIVPLSVQLIKPYMVSKENDVDYQISCYSSPSSDNVKYTWFFENSEIKNNPMIDISADNLLIKQVHRHHRGNYTCRANDGRSTGEDSAFLDVLYKPEFISPEDEWHEINLGENLHLDCSANGNPPPTVTWILPPKSNDHLDDLFIQDFPATVSGVYYCEISNSIGDEKKNFNVEIKEKPQIHNIVLSRDNIDDSKFLKNLSNADVYKVLEGFSGNFFCNSSGNPEPYFQWTKRQKEDENQEEIIFSEDQTLFIDSASSTDTGIYTCSAKNDLGEYKKSIDLYVVVPPTFRSVQDAIVMVEKGQNVVLNCDVIGFPLPEISWSFNNNTLSNDDEYYYFNKDSLSFQANFKDSGVYECLTKNDGGHAVKKIVLIVYVPPSIYPSSDEIINAKLHENTIVPCKSEGYPKPNITWLFNGSALENTEQNYSNDFGELIIINTDLMNEGMYTCVVQNQHGVAQKNFYINVNYPPKLQTTETAPIIKLLPYDTIALNCNATGNPPPKITWKKNNEIILENGDTNNVLVLTNIDENISGVYTCVAQNSEGTDEKRFQIIAIEKPIVNEVEPHLTFLNATLDDDIEILCPIKYATEYSWYKNDKHLPNENSEILELNSVSWNDHGNYTCIGSNEAGSEEFRQELNVMTAPQFFDNSKETNVDEDTNIKPKFKDINVIQGENITLKCQPEGYPMPEIEWIKDKMVLSRNPELHLENIQIIHNGDYICRASNTFGENTKFYRINVQIPPTVEREKNNWIDISKNEDIKLDCLLYGNPWPLIYWTKNGVKLDEFQETLEIKNAKINDTGLYKCIGKNVLGEQEISFVVNVLSPPEFLPTPSKEIKVTNKDALELECSVIGNPLPIVAWSFNNKVLWSTSSIPAPTESNETNEIIYTDENGNPLIYVYPHETLSNEIPDLDQYGKLIRNKHNVTALLIIENSKKKKSGIYKCHSINSLGSNEQTFDVQIYHPPNLKGNEIDKKPIVNVTVLEDLPLILYCPWQGNPNPEIIWTKDNNSIQPYNILFSNDMKTLTVFHANLNQNSGEYVCTAINDAGINHKRFSVKILVPPKFETSNDILEEDIVPYTHVIGQKTVLECPVIGNPMPEIFWLKQTEDDDDDYNDNDFEIIRTNSSQLILDDIKYSGVYSCYANNSLGYVEKKYSVEVQKIPFIADKLPEEQTFKEYQTITLRCPAEGTPKPQISWYKDGLAVEYFIQTAQFSSDKTILKIPNARKEHSGTYTCFAANSMGEIMRDTKVTVKTPVMWSNWESWSACSKSCGTGVKTRYRRCMQLNGDLSNNENECKGSSYESEICELLPCPIDGGWSEWSNWSACPMSCINASDVQKPTRRRQRECNYPKPMYGGKSCVGLYFEEEPCITKYCPIDGGWSDWTQWTSCSSSCGTGTKKRSRKCDNPKPAYGGSFCQGENTEVTFCNRNPCPVHGGWSGWTVWSECSKTCGTGIKKRIRTCTNPKPMNGGDNCTGKHVEFTKCRIKKCPNSSLLKTLFPLKFGPVAEYDVFDRPENEDNVSDDNFAPNSRILDKEGQKKEPINSEGMKVSVSLRTVKKIDKDVKELVLHPGLAPYKIERIIPCSLGFQLDENNQCKDIDECKLKSICEENEICKNIDGGFICSCKDGFKFDESYQKCVDIDECADDSLNSCSHACQNTIGSYLCTCPENYMLNPNNKGCGPDPLYLGNGYLSDAAFTNFTDETLAPADCLKGYRWSNGTCQDINECNGLYNVCDLGEKCLNTKGSYICLPTSCPFNYEGDDTTSSCILRCNINQCMSSANFAEIITYTILPLETVRLSQPIYTFLSYDLYGNILTNTDFILETSQDSNYFELETIDMMRKDAANLYVLSYLESEKLYNIEVTAKSYDSHTKNLIYLRKFIIYLYLF